MESKEMTNLDYHLRTKPWGSQTGVVAEPVQEVTLRKSFELFVCVLDQPEGRNKGGKTRWRSGIH